MASHHAFNPEFSALADQFKAQALADFHPDASQVLQPLLRDLAAQVQSTTTNKEALRLAHALRYHLPSRVLKMEHKELVALRAQYSLSRSAHQGFAYWRKLRMEEEVARLLLLQRERYATLLTLVPAWLRRLKQVSEWRLRAPRAYNKEAKRLRLMFSW